MIRYLESFDVQFHYSTKVVNAEFDTRNDQKVTEYSIRTGMEAVYTLEYRPRCAGGLGKCL